MSRPKRPVGPPDHSPGRNPGWPDDVRERNPGWWGEIGRMRDFFHTVRAQGNALGYHPAALQAAPGTRPIFANHFCLTITGVRRAAIHPLILEGAPLHDGCKPLGRVSPPRRGGCLPRGGEGASPEVGKVFPHVELTSMKTLIALARRRRRPDRRRCR